MRSRHIPAANKFSHAVDFACTIKGVPKWDWSLYVRLANAVKAAAIAEKVPVEWGGTWAALNSVKGAITAKMLHKSFPDGPHFQLPWSSYPGSRP
jgi:peptidoglycan L-alanyl-D-glutamate endopeptidase CwlK